MRYVIYAALGGALAAVLLLALAWALSMWRATQR